MEEFVINYFVSQITSYYTQYSNFFKYYKVEKEKQISEILQNLSNNQFNNTNILISKSKCEKTKNDFIKNFERNTKRVEKIKKIILKIKKYLKSEKEKKEKIIQKIFFSSIFEYLYKCENLHTINYFNNFPMLKKNFEKIDFSKYSLFKKIKEDLKNSKILSALKWCQKNRSKLKKKKLNLEYKLLITKLIEKIKKKEDEKQILFFIQNDIKNSTIEISELFFAISLFLNSKNSFEIPEKFSFKNIINDFYNFFFQIEGFSRNYFLENILKLGILSLKTELCHYEEKKHKCRKIKSEKINDFQKKNYIQKEKGIKNLKNSQNFEKRENSLTINNLQKNNFCPICSKWIFLLSDKIKPTQKCVTTVKCVFSKEILSENNQAVVFENNYVFGINYVKKNLKKHHGIFVCPISGKKFKENDMKTIFFV